MGQELVRLLPPLLMRAGFHDPHLEILGGGEKVLLTALETLAAEQTVELFSPREPQIERWSRLGVSVDPERVRWRAAGTLSVTPHTRGLDLFVTLFNHFPPLSLARRSLAIVQFPFAELGSPPRRWERRVRLRSYDTVVCYSEFVREHVRRRLGLEAVVVAPPVDVEGVRTGPKERKVIAVGRFFGAADANNKKHDVLIEAWRELAPPDGWELHMAGGLHDDPDSRAHLDALRRRAEGLAVSFHPNIEPDALDDLYARSTLFWHAAGHGEVDPARMEHFGITTVEAMAHGCAPVVPALGGQLEIVSPGEDGHFWGDPAELVDVSRSLMADPARAQALGAAAARSAQRFAKERFVSRFRELIGR